MAPLASKQPLKTIYTIFFILKTPLQLVLFYLRCLVKPLRPLPEWSAKENLMSRIAKIMFQYITATRSGLLLYAEAKTAEDRYSRVAPAPDSLYAGVLHPSDNIKPGPVEAVWFPDPPPGPDADRAILKKKKVVIHFPGGAYIMGFSYKDFGLEISKAMAEHVKADITIWAQYRLSHSPETRFPAALQDALTFYQHVLSLGYDPKNVILSGDSAGGNAVIALVRYLTDRQKQKSGVTDALPLPGGAIVFSPWVTVTMKAAKDYDQYPHSQSDCLWGPLLEWGVEAFVPEGNLSSEVQAYVSPLHHPFELSVPLVIHAGEVEAFYPDIKAFAEEMVQLNEDVVQYHSTPRASHDLLVSHATFGLTKERGFVLESARELFWH